LSFLQLRQEYIDPTADLEEAVSSSDHVLFAVPSAYLESTVSDLDPSLMADRIVMTSIKGIVPHHRQIPSDFLAKKFGTDPRRHQVIGGPCHAEEIALERKTYVTVASREETSAAQVADSVQSHYIKTIVNTDPLGVEMCAILKNVVGIACGMAHGLNYGDNFQAVLVANAMREMRRFLKAQDPVERDLSHSAYFGDLLVTAYSEYSRNRNFGQMIGRGYSVQLAQLQMNMIAEGYYAVEGIYEMARRLGVDMPVVSAVYRILYNRISPYMEFKLLENKLV
jgi:glycerol-3-phosphate dehydrogenase (NAD(P)+)